MKTNANLNTLKAKELLEKNGYTCVFINEKTVYKSTERGVKPLLNLIEEKADVKGSFVADKVIGKAAAFLYVLLKVKEIYSLVISAPAKQILENNGIYIFYDKLVERIENRKKDGFCPMEECVLNCNSPEKALFLIKEKLKTL